MAAGVEPHDRESSRGVDALRLVCRYAPRMEQGPRPGGGGLAALVAGIVAAGVLVLFGGRLPTGGDPEPEIPDLPPITLPADPADQALDLVASFAEALDAGDAEGMSNLLADDVRVFGVPGFAFPRARLRPPGPVDDRVAVLAAIATLELGPCLPVEPSPGAGVDWVVDCPDGRFVGPFLDVMGGLDPGVWFSIDRGEIVAVDDQTSYASFHPRWCAWAETEGGFTGIFDLSCRPRFDPALAPGLVAAAEAWIAAGRPEPAPESLRARLQLDVVARFLTGLAGTGEQAATLVHPDLDVRATPGHLGGPEPDPLAGQFVRWLAAVYDLEVDTTACGYGGAPGRVRCSDVRWGGPLIQAARLDPAPVTLEFSVRDGLVAEIEGGFPAAMDTWLRAYCGWIRRVRPAEAPYVVMGDCAPVYTGWGGSGLALLADDYRVQ